MGFSRIRPKNSQVAKLRENEHDFKNIYWPFDRYYTHTRCEKTQGFEDI
jgi:hypothetical protein